MEYYSAIRKNAILPFVPTWLDLEDITVNEISQTEEHKNSHYHLYVESEKKMKQTKEFNRNRLTDIENKLWFHQ